jgi:predicted PurR-regulated permease PerM
MRNGVAAIVPLMFAIVVLFMFIMFMGGASDTQKAVSSVENLKHLQSKLLLPALKKRYQEERENGLSQTAASASANTYVQTIMQNNGIDQ